MSPQDVMDFWFKELRPEHWFKKDAQVDATIRERFWSTFTAAEKCELFHWRNSPEGSLAEIILLDQFSRNLFRGDAHAFQNDALALSLAQTAVEKGFDQDLPVQQRGFLYMPYMHSESEKIHQVAVELFSQKGLEFNLKFEFAHQKIIQEFGRYPHRNKALGRTNTPAEEDFLRKNPEGF